MGKDKELRFHSGSSLLFHQLLATFRQATGRQQVLPGIQQQDSSLGSRGGEGPSGYNCVIFLSNPLAKAKQAEDHLNLRVFCHSLVQAHNVPRNDTTNCHWLWGNALFYLKCHFWKWLLAINIANYVPKELANLNAEEFNESLPFSYNLTFMIYKPLFDPENSCFLFSVWHCLIILYSSATVERKQ